MQAWRATGRTAGGDEAVARSVAAVLSEIAVLRAERAAPPVRTARLRLAAVHGRARLAKHRARETA